MLLAGQACSQLNAAACCHPPPLLLLLRAVCCPLPCRPSRPNRIAPPSPPPRSAFGAKAVDPKPIMKALPALFGHTQAGVRDKAKEVAVQLCAYLGQVGAGG